MKKTKEKTVYVCQDCGTGHIKWQGQCSGCGAWNTLVEEISANTKKSIRNIRNSDMQPLLALPIQEILTGDEMRIPLPDAELQRVLSGGLVPGSLILLAGEPGIGKSTLLLQLALRLSPRTVLYASGEESARQVRMRADRLPYTNTQLYILAESELEPILEVADQLSPVLVIIDSIQTMFLDALDSAPGSVAQVRECATRLQRFAKSRATAVLLVGHVNKEGMIAGPKVLEHTVDTVLEFEGDRQYNYRILRSIKNRFGSTPELGIYEMQSSGLREVANASELFLSANTAPLSGVAIGAILQGMRPLLLETQALVSESVYGTAQRSATGFDNRRLNMLLAVLEKKCGLKMGNKDVFVNLAGGLKVEDPSLDLALVAALVSSFLDIPISSRTAFCAEVGLTGEVRAVSRIEPRITEAEKLGFNQIFIALPGGKVIENEVQMQTNIRVHCVSRLPEVFELLFEN